MFIDFVIYRFILNGYWEHYLLLHDGWLSLMRIRASGKTGFPEQELRQTVFPEAPLVEFCFVEPVLQNPASGNPNAIN